MVKHVILWQLKDDIENKEEVLQGIKDGLEGLAGKIPGMTDIQVNIGALPTSNADAMLEATFLDVEALKGYSEHPEHVAVATTKIRPFYKNRVCLDYKAKEWEIGTAHQALH